MVKSALALSALLFSSAAFAAPESLSKVDTSKGEMLLELMGTGTTSAKIVKVSTTCDMKASAQGKSEAMALLKKQQDGLESASRIAGLTSSTLDFSAPATFSAETYVTSAADAAVSAAADAVEAVKAAPAGSETASQDLVQAKPYVEYIRRVGVSTNLATEMQIVRGLIKEFDCEEDYRAVRNTVIELADPEVAKAAAVKIAVALAQAQAENYASALNLKVKRLLRVSEVGAIREFLGPESEALIKEMRIDRDRQNLITNDLPVSATISADFVLGPK